MQTIGRQACRVPDHVLENARVGFASDDGGISALGDAVEQQHRVAVEGAAISGAPGDAASLPAFLGDDTDDRPRSVAAE